ncbi:hypothetical protein [Halorubrum saccharovorum]|uniref:hypothetical protein n=1 Tax=Halorubrum saccharovorum TaxID=2248 RepID=UPI0012687F1F|nr:hypothetical protein [Halorubrum saccharovorum]
MPAQREYTVSDDYNDTEVLRFSIEGDLERWRSVYFTDQSPNFTLTVENLTEKKVDGTNWPRLIFDESDDDYDSAEQMNCTLKPRDTTSLEFRHDMLSYQGNAAIGIHPMTASEKDGRYSLSRDHDRIERLYTFMVYDRDYYKLNYLRPRRAQYAAALLTVLVVVVGVIQLLNTAGAL